MKAEKLSISLDADLGASIYAAAEREGLSVSAWMARAAAGELRRAALGAFLQRWQRKHGKLSASELAHARSELGYPDRRR